MAKKAKKNPKRVNFDRKLFDQKLSRAKERLNDNLRHYLLRRRPDLRPTDNWPAVLAEITGIGVTSAQRYLNPFTKTDYSFPKLDQLILMADGFGISLNELLAQVYYPAHEEGSRERFGGGGGG